MPTWLKTCRNKHIISLFWTQKSDRFLFQTAVFLLLSQAAYLSIVQALYCTGCAKSEFLTTQSGLEIHLSFYFTNTSSFQFILDVWVISESHISSAVFFLLQTPCSVSFVKCCSEHGVLLLSVWPILVIYSMPVSEFDPSDLGSMQ